MRVREKPPLRMSIEILAPNGRYFRWGEDEFDPANVFGGLSFSSTMPGGFESFGCTLPRQPGVDYSDLTTLSRIRVLGASGDVLWEGRLERTPRASGDQIAISPSASGYSASLEDRKDCKALIIDIDLSKWGPPSTARRLALLANYAPTDAQTSPGSTSGLPLLRTAFTGPWTTAPGRPISEALYDAKGLNIGSVVYAWTKGPLPSAADANYTWQALLGTDDTFASNDSSGNLRAAGPGIGTLTATAERTAALVHFFYANVAAGGPPEYNIDWNALIVIGDHGLTLRSGTDVGFYSSDIEAYLIQTFAPWLSTEIEASSFVLPQLAFLEPTTLADMLTQTRRYEVRDWAIWEGPTYHSQAFGTGGRKWRARSGTAQLSETGPQVDRLWESVVVAYQDTDGSTRTVGPTSSGADTESDLLHDEDPENPANQLGITRREALSIGTSTPAGAIKVGQEFLDKQKTLDTSGSASHVGFVEDDHGVIWPASVMRAGDQVGYVDSNAPDYRRIVKANHDRDTRTTSVDLDSPPDALQELLERLGARVLSLGFTN